MNFGHKDTAMVGGFETPAPPRRLDLAEHLPKTTYDVYEEQEVDPIARFDLCY